MDNQNKRLGDNWFDERKFDELLDDTLAGYSNVEPHAGLEGRILARLSGIGQARPSLWARWWPAFSFAAAVLFAIAFLFLPRQASHPDLAHKVPPPAITSVAHGLQVTDNAAIAHHRQALGSVHSAVPTKRLPNPTAFPAQFVRVKQPVFPTPSPLSEQERLLLAYVRRTDPQEIAANAKPDDIPILEKQINQALPLRKNADSNINTN